MRTFGCMDYVHRIEYHRRGPEGKLDLAYEETVEDHGWYIRKEADWKSYYTRECAVDFLERVEAKGGTFAVAVWRGKARVCTVGIEWRPSGG